VVGYALGVDLGTTFTAAALARRETPEAVALGGRSNVIPSVLWLGEDGQILVGEAAERHVMTDPGRVTREFKRRVGDPTPLLIGGAPYSAEALMARLLRWVVDNVTRLEGSAAESIAVTFPANWGPYKRELLQQTIKIADLDQAITVPEPVAAASYYASTAKIAPGEVIAAYDLGGGTFDAAVLRRTDSGFEILGTPDGIERLGGIDFDEAIFEHIVRMAGDPLGELDPTDQNVLASVQRLRDEAVRAKESLSLETDVSVPVLLPNRNTQVRLTRAEFEEMIRPQLSDTVAALRRSMRSAAVDPGQLTAVLLVGGSSRIPLVTQVVSASLGRPVAVDAHPKNAVALGAALAAWRARSTPAFAAASAGQVVASAGQAAAGGGQVVASPDPVVGQGGPAAQPDATPVGPPPRAPVRPASRARLQAVVPSVLGLAVIAVGAYFLLSHHSHQHGQSLTPRSSASASTVAGSLAVPGHSERAAGQPTLPSPTPLDALSAYLVSASSAAASDVPSSDTADATTGEPSNCTNLPSGDCGLVSLAAGQIAWEIVNDEVYEYDPANGSQATCSGDWCLNLIANSGSGEPGMASAPEVMRANLGTGGNSMVVVYQLADGSTAADIVGYSDPNAGSAVVAHVPAAPGAKMAVNTNGQLLLYTPEPGTSKYLASIIKWDRSADTFVEVPVAFVNSSNVP
jgi:actin-like ATPase involved in cell morphogenesis